jgi:hypothetical protein
MFTGDATIGSSTPFGFAADVSCKGINTDDLVSKPTEVKQF